MKGNSTSSTLAALFLVLFCIGTLTSSCQRHQNGCPTDITHLYQGDYEGIDQEYLTEINKPDCLDD